MFRETQPLSIDPWGHIADEIMRPQIAQDAISHLNKFHHFESATILILAGASILEFASGYPELTMLTVPIALAGGISWAETSNEILRLRIKNHLFSN